MKQKLGNNEIPIVNVLNVTVQCECFIVPHSIFV